MSAVGGGGEAEKMRKPVEVVAAVARNGVIGRGQQLPWHLPDDLRHFKALTTGGTVIMGRRTFESIGKALPNRRCIVVSRQMTAPPVAGVEVAGSLDEAIRMAQGSAGRVFVIGGGELYAAALPIARVMHLTELDEDVEGDVVFPPIDWGQWRLEKAVRHERDERHATGFRMGRYERVE